MILLECLFSSQIVRYSRSRNEKRHLKSTVLDTKTHRYKEVICVLNQEQRGTIFKKAHSSKELDRARTQLGIARARKPERPSKGLPLPCIPQTSSCSMA